MELSIEFLSYYKLLVNYSSKLTVDLSILKRESKRFPSLVPKRSNIPDRLHQRSMNVLGRFIAV